MTDGARVDTRLQLIAGPDQLNALGPERIAETASGGGATLLQWRDKGAATRSQIESARRLLRACAGSGLPVIVNDRIDVALAAGCAGVHLGQDDMALDDARRVVGANALIGVTLRSDLDIERTPLALADYVSIGGVFPTSSKTDAGDPIGVDGLARLVGAVRTRFSGPIIAISGISAETLPAVLAAGADGIAVIGAVWQSSDPVAVLTTMRSIVDDHLRSRKSP